jgi:hypothetical protein
MTPEKWTTVIGHDPQHFDFAGMDPHMIQSIEPRPGLSGADLPRGNNGTDPIHGREWQTAKGDRQYACTFTLPTPRDCHTDDDRTAQSCDCLPASSAHGNLNWPLCGPNDTQVKAKAYPTPRQFYLAHDLKDQGVIASLCPIQLTDKAAADYGYNPAVDAIIDRLKNALTTQCLPQALRDRGAGSDEPKAVDCLVLAQLDPSDSCARYGFDLPPTDILRVYRDQQRAEWGLDLSNVPVCVVPKRTALRGDSCKDDPNRVWCYVENDPAHRKSPAGQCPQAVIFSAATSDVVNARFSLQCINQLGAGEAAGGAGD